VWINVYKWGKYGVGHLSVGAIVLKTSPRFLS